MAEVTIVNEKTIKIAVQLEDALTMIRDAQTHITEYAFDIVTMVEKMPQFNYTYFCFYAYDSAALFERMLDTDPKQYTSFSLDAPDSFFYALYGGMTGLYEEARLYL
ncbi:hypothetical protein SAMN04487969_104272 [Paenibacillus algorifonticola]|uniref:Uncharacterized protein n=1 Tax=Paenibacillus algorifonticola TaxID=684063 RepID=A0A1I2C4E0_9BACL|nr:MULTISPECIES: hypothetical protein [Paenibacillus]KQO17297.1 hypothetical protein ASF12_00965 [Paenibacillus sp. Leaf72]SFE63251.1 hypothetical protein SAMN04487969_104272 [Paenibacillus algorifonticola]